MKEVRDGLLDRLDLIINSKSCKTKSFEKKYKALTVNSDSGTKVVK